MRLMILIKIFRTLQEGVLSARRVFRFQRSFAILGLLHVLVEKLRHDIVRNRSLIRIAIGMLLGKSFCQRYFPRERHVCEKLDHEPLTGAIAVGLLRVVNTSLAIQELHNYPRGPVSLEKIPVGFGSRTNIG